jgi:chemotaxis protein methyltransferase CheR
MKDRDGIDLLQWALPRLRMRWAGFRRVRRQVCRRIRARMRELDLSGAQAYREFLEKHREEWRVLDSLLRIPISRFYRDRGVFERIQCEVLPDLVQRFGGAIRCWCAGSASGEEPYTVSIVGRESVPEASLSILATEVEEHLLERARRAVYARSSLKELPPSWIERAFLREGDEYRLRDSYRAAVEFRREDIREAMPEGPFHVVFCRYLAFTYFEESLQQEVLEGIRERITPGGVLVIGAHEKLPAGARGFEQCGPRMFRRR